MRAVCDCGWFDVLCLVTNPQRYDKNGKPIITPARQFAAEYNIAISDKDDVHSREFSDFLYLMRPDLLFVCDFGQILPKRVTQGSLLGGINLHGSLLPKFRGAAPVNWAILNGEAYTGVSIIHITPQVDAGPVIAQSPPIPIGFHETVLGLEERLAEYGAELVLNTVQKMASSGTIKILEQLHEKASKAPRLKKEDGLVPWERSSRDIHNHYRAMTPWPKSFTDWNRSDETKTRLILGEVQPLNDLLEEHTEEDFNGSMFVGPILTDAKMDNLADLLAERKGNPLKPKRQPSRRPSWWKPGTVIRADGSDLIIAAGEGAVKILKIQPAGKKMMDVRDFLLGYPIQEGDRLGNERR